MALRAEPGLASRAGFGLGTSTSHGFALIILDHIWPA